MAALTTREKLIEAGHEIFYREELLAVDLDRLLNEVACSKKSVKTERFRGSASLGRIED